MSLFAFVNTLAANFLAADGPVPNDGVGSVSLHPIFPPIGELIAGSLASIIIFAAHHIDANPLGLVRYDLISAHQFSLCIRQEPQNRLLESKRDPSIDHIRLVQPRSKNRRGSGR
mgnify:CR=1 FL=1